jgi:hypothetical protein
MEGYMSITFQAVQIRRPILAKEKHKNKMLPHNTIIFSHSIE